ncbi:MAG: TIGR00153 family protein [Nitrospinaceae bacterium]|nr:MAG: TIGR00153 family protein [Nitrospinaceae bacterium]
MRSILSLFSKSPFRPLVSHIEKVRACVDQLKPLFAALEGHDYQAVMDISEVIIKFEHEADSIKDQIRQSLAHSVFLPVDKRDFMHLLSAQDDIADSVEDLAVLLRIKNIETPDQIKETLKNLVDHVINTAHMACDLICELDVLLEASFGGAEAEKVEKAASQLGTAEWEADRKQFLLAQQLYSLDDQIKTADLILWNEVVKNLGAVADKSEKIAKILRLFISN